MSVTPAELARTLLRRAADKREHDQAARAMCRREVVRLMPELRRELGFGRAWLVGSLAWGSFGERAEIDVVIEAASVGIANAVAERIGDATGRPVDARAFETLSPTFQDRVLEDGLHVA